VKRCFGSILASPEHREGSMLADNGWIYIVAGLLLAAIVALAIPYAAGRSFDSRRDGARSARKEASDRRRL
jgi:hypothetical protein